MVLQLLKCWACGHSAKCLGACMGMGDECYQLLYEELFGISLKFMNLFAIDQAEFQQFLCLTLHQQQPCTEVHVTKGRLALSIQTQGDLLDPLCPTQLLCSAFCLYAFGYEDLVMPSTFQSTCLEHSFFLSYQCLSESLGFLSLCLLPHLMLFSAEILPFQVSWLAWCLLLMSEVAFSMNITASNSELSLLIAINSLLFVFCSIS